MPKMSEEEKMLSGKIYDGSDEKLYSRRLLAHELCRQFNITPESDFEKRSQIIDKLFPHHGKNCFIQGPMQVDYGSYSYIGNNFYCNFNLTILDSCPITIGDNVFLGPNVSIVTPIHPFLAKERNTYVNEKGKITDKEYAAPIVIEGNNWIASNVTICGGVTIGEGSVIGAGSVVIRDIPKNSLAAGNPCRVIRELTEQDSIYLKSKLF